MRFPKTSVLSQLLKIANHRRQYPKDQKIPVVIPLLVYNGKKSPYPKNLDIMKLFHNPTLTQTTFAKSAHLIDLRSNLLSRRM